MRLDLRFVALIGLSACGGGAPAPVAAPSWEGAPPELLPDAFVAGLEAAVATCSQPLEFAVDCAEPPCVVMYRQGGAQPASDCPGWRTFGRKASDTWKYALGGGECATGGMAPIWPAMEVPAQKERAYVRAMAMAEQLCATE